LKGVYEDKIKKTPAFGRSTRSTPLNIFAQTQVFLKKVLDKSVLLCYNEFIKRKGLSQ
jgi:hypothetical protein